MWRATAAKVAMLAVLGAALGACGSDEDEGAEIPMIRPVKTLIIEDAIQLQRDFPATIEASRRVDLSFRVPGKLAVLAVKEGDEVRTGDVLAELDPTDYRLARDRARAELDRTRGDWERAQVLVRQGHLSRSDFDNYESAYRQADAALEQAELDLSYTVLKAPIDSTVARRAIQNFEEVEAGQEVLALRDNSELEVRIEIPEKIMMQLILDEDPEARAADTGFWVSFPAAGRERFPLRIKELATRADPSTQTFQARFIFAAPPDLNVLPGMSAMVTVDITELSTVKLDLELPAAAVDRRSDQPRVWVYDPEVGRAIPHPVEVGPELGGQIQILEGLELGDRVIIAGAAYVTEDQELYEMPRVEQAR